MILAYGVHTGVLIVCKVERVLIENLVAEKNACQGLVIC